jgi:hypothetical protein
VNQRLLQNYLSRHYHLTVAVLAISTYALIKHLISGDNFVEVATGILTCFRAGDAVDTWLRGRQNGSLCSNQMPSSGRPADSHL